MRSKVRVLAQCGGLGLVVIGCLLLALEPGDDAGAPATPPTDPAADGPVNSPESEDAAPGQSPPEAARSSVDRDRVVRVERHAHDAAPSHADEPGRGAWAGPSGDPPPEDSDAAGDPAPHPDTSTRAYRFGNVGDDDHWVRSRGWDREYDRLIGSGDPKAPSRFGPLTLKKHYASIEKLTIRGGIREGHKHNFRVQAGPFSLIFNWELADENHFRSGTKRSVVKPSALTPGKEHAITLEQDGAQMHVSVDGKRLWSGTGRLHGVVTIYPALGSEIEVREVVVTGREVPDVQVLGPSYPLQ